MPLQEGHLFADYEITAKLGKGGMGEVYQARQPVLKRLVALKVLSPALAADEGFVKRFQTEAAAAANLSHPNIVPVYTAGVSEGIHYIAMEYVEGQSLRKRLEDGGRLDPEQALEICYYFGLAKSLSGNERATMTGTTMGSPHYLSPEQARGDRDIDFRTDIYSLGCTLFQLLTGHCVYRGDTPMSVILQHLQEPPPSVLEWCPHCPPALAALVERMLAKTKEDRPSSYDQLIAELLAIRQQLEHGTGVMPGASSGTAPGHAAHSPQPAKKRLVALLLILCVAALGGAGWWAYGLRQKAAETAVTPDDPRIIEHFLAATAYLPPEKQLDEVMETMRQINPGFVSKEKHTVEDGHITELSFSAAHVRKLWPVAALRDLQKLSCTGDAEKHHQAGLVDLSPLRELELKELDVSWTKVQSLEPLREMALTALRCASTHVEDLSPLKGMSLAELDCANTLVRDLSPLRGMPLLSLNCQNAPVRSLVPLRDMPLRELKCDFRPTRDGEVLRSLKSLKELNDRPLPELRKPKRAEGLNPNN
ncbi:MAG: protein kinase [Verrucomicrobia bacterium]|nr:protein kinase [Verrucomicrobiota bacterium]